MSDREFRPGKETGYDAVPKNGLTELPPADDAGGKAMPWRKAINRVLTGLALSTFTLNVLGLNYLLPGIGIVLLLLGFRALRRENQWFHICWIISVLRTVYFWSLLILNATIWRRLVSQLLFFTALPYVNLAVTFALIFCLRGGFRAVQQKAGRPVHTAALSALLIGYVIMCALGIVGYEGIVIGILLLIAYGFIVYNLYRLSSQFNEVGDAIRTAPARVPDHVLGWILAAVLVFGMAAGYLFLSSYPMKWSAADASEQAGLQKIKTHLLDLGYPQEALDDLTAEDLADCGGALRVIAAQSDHPVDYGGQIVDQSGNSMYILSLEFAAIMINGTFAQHDTDCTFQRHSHPFLSHPIHPARAGVLLLLSKVTQKHF